MNTIQINPADNVIVALSPLAKGTAVAVPGVGEVVAAEDIPQGHKMAVRAIAAGEDVVKYGLPIGHVTGDIQPGQWLHTHNVKTNLSGEVEYAYNPTHPVVEPVEPETFMGFHCGNTASSKLSFCEMKYQKIMARTLPEEVTQGTLEGDIVPGDITFYRLQSTSDAKLRGYIAEGEVLPVATRSFGSIGIFAIPEMGRFYRHVLVEKNYPHHGAVAFGHFGKPLFEVFKMLGVEVDEIGYNQPKGVRYPTENPWG